MLNPKRRLRSSSDEHYIINLCDRVLARKASRQHRFDFLLGDPGKSGRCAKLPVDAYYQDLGLVVEVMERQHNEPTPLFDRRMTVSGITRGEQRKLSDARRAKVLESHKIKLIRVDIRRFVLKSKRRLVRNVEQDEQVVRELLIRFLPRVSG